MKLHRILKMSQSQLFDTICQIYPQAIVEEKEYIFVPGTLPVMLVAHLDTVHKEPVKHICTTHSGNVIMSPQGIGGDDRCGVYALLKLWKAVPGKHPSLLFTCNEEVGGLGAKAFAMDWAEEPHSNMKFKYMIELDRRGKHDAVFYECINCEFEEYVQSFNFHTAWGTYSDICDVAPVVGVAAVNLSVGYYNAHTQYEYIKVSELQQTIHKVKKMLLDIDNAPVYEYIEDNLYCRWDELKYNSGPVVRCEICGAQHRRDDMELVDNDLLCPECIKNYCYMCDSCGRYSWDVRKVCIDEHEEHLCQSCYEWLTSME